MLIQKAAVIISLINVDKYILAGFQKPLLEYPVLLLVQRGYTGKGKEHAKGRNTGDLKEFYHVGQELSASELKQEGYPSNIWPEEVPDFRSIAVDTYRALEKTGSYLLRAIALYLRLPENYFDDKILHGNSILRPR